MIEEVLRETRGNKQETAQASGPEAPRVDQEVETTGG